jgi:hypothetical protein
VEIVLEVPPSILLDDDEVLLPPSNPVMRVVDGIVNIFMLLNFEFDNVTNLAIT